MALNYKFEVINLEIMKTQTFNRPITEIIEKRSSIRSFKPNPLSQKDNENLLNYLNSAKGLFNVPIRFKIVDAKIQQLDSNLKLGTYGIIRGTSLFIVASVKNLENNMLELGYILEKGVLYATSLGVGTCWLGGTFKKGEFAKALELQDDEVLPIISPIGYPADSRRVFENIMRLAVGSEKRKNWSDLFFKENFNTALRESECEGYADVLEMVRLAPSASNKQPWRILQTETSFDFYLEHTKGYGNALGFDIQKVDIGIALCHFELTAKEFGLKGEWRKIEVSTPVNSTLTEYIISWIKK